MAATNFFVDLPGALPSGAPIRLTNKPAVFPALGFNVVGLDDTYPSSGTPVTPALGLGSAVAQSGIIDATYDGDRYFFVVPAPAVVVSILLIASVIEATGNSTTVDVKKTTGAGQAISAGTTLLAAAINLKTGVVADTTLSLPLTATTANLTLAANNGLALDFTNAITEFIGCLQVNLNYI